MQQTIFLSVLKNRCTINCRSYTCPTAPQKRHGSSMVRTYASVRATPASCRAIATSDCRMASASCRVYCGIRRKMCLTRPLLGTFEKHVSGNKATERTIARRGNKGDVFLVHGVCKNLQWTSNSSLACLFHHTCRHRQTLSGRTPAGPA